MQKITFRKLIGENYIYPELQGHFIEFLGSCIYDGIWVGEDSEIPNYHGIRKDLVDAFQKLHPPVIRWPGGCMRMFTTGETVSDQERTGRLLIMKILVHLKPIRISSVRTR